MSRMHALTGKLDEVATAGLHASAVLYRYRQLVRRRRVHKLLAPLIAADRSLNRHVVVDDHDKIIALHWQRARVVRLHDGAEADDADVDFTTLFRVDDPRAGARSRVVLYGAGRWLEV